MLKNKICLEHLSVDVDSLMAFIDFCHVKKNEIKQNMEEHEFFEEEYFMRNTKELLYLAKHMMKKLQPYVELLEIIEQNKGED